MATNPTTSITRTGRVEASQPGKLDAWIDFNGNGQFDPSEHLGGGVSFSLVAGFNLIEFTIPAGSTVGGTFARFRFSSAGGLAPTGFAADGEVEDYRVTIVDQSETAPPNPASEAFETALNTAVEEFFAAFPEELQNPDGTVPAVELPIAAAASGGAAVAGRNLGQETDPALRPTVESVNQVIGRTVRRFENVFVLVIHPVDFVLTDPQGREIGFTEAGGFVNEQGINASYSGDGVVELLTIRNAEAGRYNLELVGVGTIFRGGASLITADGVQSITFEGSLIVDQNFDLALDYSQPLDQSIPSRTGDRTVRAAELIPANLSSSDNSDLAISTAAAQQIQTLQSRPGDVLNDADPNQTSPLDKFLQWVAAINQGRCAVVNTVSDSLDLPFVGGVTLPDWLQSDDAADDVNATTNLNSFWLGLSGSLMGIPSELYHLGEFLGELIPSTSNDNGDSPENRATADDDQSDDDASPSNQAPYNEKHQPTRRQKSATRPDRTPKTSYDHPRQRHQALALAVARIAAANSVLQQDPAQHPLSQPRAQPPRQPAEIAATQPDSQSATSDALAVTSASQ